MTIRGLKMNTYTIVSNVHAIPMDKDTAGQNGYLNYFNGTTPVDKIDGYAFLNSYTGNIQWIKKEDFEKQLLISNSLS